MNFFTADIREGEITNFKAKGEPVAVYYVNGQYCATHDLCTHVGGLLSEGWLLGVVEETWQPEHASLWLEKK